MERRDFLKTALGLGAVAAFGLMTRPLEAMPVAPLPDAMDKPAPAVGPAIASADDVERTMIENVYWHRRGYRRHWRRRSWRRRYWRRRFW
jgi:hypothetical protein